MVRDSAQVLEDMNGDEGGQVGLSYYHVERSREEIVTIYQGDLFTICNALSDYADLLDDYLKSEYNRLGPCGVFQYEAMRDKCRKISNTLQEKIGYDRNAAIEKCRKKAGRGYVSDQGIGEDALILAGKPLRKKRRRRKTRSKKQLNNKEAGREGNSLLFFLPDMEERL